MIKKSLAFFALFVVGLLTHAHSPTELGFKFVEENDQTYLEIHLTTITLFDLLYSVEPELKTSESLNLSQYVTTYEAYFNQALDLNLNGRDRELAYVDANLIVHDASIKFLVKDFEEDISSYALTIGGFAFYQKPSFTVLFRTNSVDQTYFLNKVENACAGFGNQPTTAKVDSRYWIGGTILLFSISILVVWWSRNRTLQVGR